MIPVFSPLTGLAGMVRSLFSAGEQGVWYDPSDLSTLYQDAAGTTPVTAVEQPVGRMLDKSGRGNHATQATTTSRPTLSARVNLLTATETLATQTVTTLATTQTLRFEGAGTVTLSGTATGTYSAGSHSVTTTAGNLTLTVSGTVTKADLRATNMGVGLPAYQRVNTATDYDTAGFPMYLRFDGVDDWLVTPSINFTSTDKMTVFAGVRKLSDAALGFVAEINDGNVVGNKYVSLRSSTRSALSGASLPFSNYEAAVHGSSNQNVEDYVSYLTTNAFTAPTTSVLSFSVNIALKGTESVYLRANALVPARQSGSFTGTSMSGNLPNAPLYIGRRGGISNQFNGHLYSLIVRGAATDDLHLTHAEKYLAYKSGVTL